MIRGMLGRKVGMMRLYDGAGRARGVTAIQLGPNRVTQIRTGDRDGYAAVQVGMPATASASTAPRAATCAPPGPRTRPSRCCASSPPTTPPSTRSAT